VEKVFKTLFSPQKGTELGTLLPSLGVYLTILSESKLCSTDGGMTDE
jgi:hypothetical protein